MPRPAANAPGTEQAAIAALVELSGRVADAEDPDLVPLLLLEVANAHLGAEVVLVYRTLEDGAPALVGGHGLEPEVLAPDDLLDSGLGDRVLRDRPDIRFTETHLLMSAGGLFGAMVLGYREGSPTALKRELAQGLTDVAATALDRAFRTHELVQTIAALQASREELARTESLRRMGQMAAVVAHEVKNPLASISGVLQVLRNRFPAGGSEHEVVGKLLDRLGELDKMVDELLQFARPRQPARGPVALPSFLADVVLLFRQDPTTSAVSLELDCDEVTLPLDRGMVQRVLLNLLLNATQAMDGRGRIAMTGRIDGDQVRIRIDDSGPGIPHSDWDKVFEPFYTTKARGSGLGLPIARRVLEAHGGGLTVEQSALGGASFQAVLPRS